MTTEEFFAFGIHSPPYRYLRDELGEKPLRKKIHYIGKLMQVLNAHTTKTTTFMPLARQELPNVNLEAVHCNHCRTYLPIRRINATITNSPSLSPKTSNYLTQPLAYCKCLRSAVLVDHRGLLRVYGSSLSLVNYLEHHPIHHQLSLQTHLEVPISLLDDPKPQYERIVTPRYLWQTSLIDLSNLTVDQCNIVLPTTSKRVKEYYQNYCYNHKVFILTARYLVLPSGIVLSIKDPYLSSLLEAPMERPNYLQDIPNLRLGGILRSIKRTHEHLLHTNKLMEELNNRLIAHYNLPDVQPSLYAYQTIGYLQLTYHKPPTPHRRGNRIYILPEDAKAITLARNVARKILRNILNTMSVQMLLRDISIRSFAKIPPPTIYMSLSAPKKLTPLLHNYRGTIKLPKVNPELYL